jgi:hypothetical protein
MELFIYTFIFGVGLLIIIMLGFYIYQYLKPVFKKEPQILLQNTIELDPTFSKKYSSNEIKLPEINKGDALGVTYAFKIFLENAMENEKWGNRFDQLKPIINNFPSVYYHPYENYLEFGVEIQDNIQMNSYQTVKYNNPPLQKWLNIVVVFSSTKIQIFLDNELIITKKLKNPPIIKPRPIQIGETNNNIKGQYGPIIYWAYPLDINEISNATNLIRF